MRQIFLTGIMPLIAIACLAQAPSDDQKQRITNYFQNYGYQYLQAAHLSCDVKTVGVYFSTDQNSQVSYVTVGLTYKDFLDQQFTCYYSFTWGDGYFTNMSWECHSPDAFKCYNACDDSRELILRLLERYRQQHPSPDNGNGDQEIMNRLERLFNRQLSRITCGEFCYGFILLDWLDKGNAN